MPLVRLDSVDALGELDAGSIGILPVAATEAHGPHLPVSTDCDIAEGHLSVLGGHAAPELDLVVLPLQRIGASLEHMRFQATKTREAEELVDEWFSIAQAFRAAGGRRLVIVSSHGGNSATVDIVTLKARAYLDMLAVGTAWLRFGYPEGLFSDEERRYGIHGGDIETSLMLHYAPGKVDMGKAGDFVSNLLTINTQMRLLSANGPHRFGWLSNDLNDLGVAGKAGAARAEKGAALASHIVKGFAALLDDVAAFDLGWLK